MLSLLLLPSALATSTCDEIQNMVSIGLPESALIEAVQLTKLTQEDLACLETTGLPEGVMTAARSVTVSGPASTVPADQPVQTTASGPTPTPGGPSPSTTFPDTTIPQRYLLATPTPDCGPARLLLTLPEPGAAAALSGFVGFGAGNFYARRPTAGMFAAFPQVLGLGLLVVGLAPGADLPEDARKALVATGGTIAGVGRMADVGLAVNSAHIARQQALDRCGQ